MSLVIPFYSVRMDYSMVPVNTSSWTQLVASLPKTAQFVEIFDSSGEAISLGLGGAGDEAQYLIIPPGGNDKIELFLPTLSRISLKALESTANTGEIIINFYNQ